MFCVSAQISSPILRMLLLAIFLMSTAIPAGGYPNEISDSIDSHVPGCVNGVYLNSDDSRLYVAYWVCPDDSRVEEFDLSDNSFIQSIAFGSCHGDVVLSSDDRYLFAPNYYFSDVSRIDLLDGNAETTLGVGSSWPADIDITPDKSKILVKVGMDGRSYDMNNDQITIIDVASFSILAEVPLNDEPANQKIGFSSDGTKAYVTANKRKSSSAMLYEISLQLPYEVLDTLPIGGADWPDFSFIGVAVSSNYVYVSDSINGQLLVIDLTTFNQVSTIPIGGTPRTMAITPDGRYLYVLNLDQSVSIIDLSDNTVIEIITGLNENPADIEFSKDGLKAYISYREGASLAVTVLTDPLCEYHDDFEDGAISACYWLTGGAKRGWAPEQDTGVGDWTISIEEIMDADGYLNMRVEGPSSGMTYGAEAWTRTVCDFNDGKNHLINFTWEAVAAIEGHFDKCYIQITDGYIPERGYVHWPNDMPEGTFNLLWHDNNGALSPGEEYTSGLPKMSWSIKVCTNGAACLYDGPDANGNLIYDTILDQSYEWHLRFMVMDATSAGFGPGDSRLNLYDFTAYNYICGDANGDCTANLGDAVYLGNFVFHNGSAPDPLCAGDANGDCSINVGDAVYLVNYVFKSGPAPLCGCFSGGKCCGCGDMMAKAYRLDSPEITTRFDGKKTTIEIESAFDLYGVQFDIECDENAVITNLTENTQLYEGHSGGQARVGLLDMKGEGYIPAGQRTILEISGPANILSALGADENGTTVDMIIGPAEKIASLPEAFSLSQNHPNPFNPITTISFNLPEASDVMLDVFNIAGQKVATLVDSYLEAGSHTVTWDSKDSHGQPVASGIYLYRIKAGSHMDTKKMLLLK